MKTYKTYKPQVMKDLLYLATMLLIPCFGVMAQSPTENYIKTTTYTAPSTGTITENDTLVNVTYFDGLGRPKQSVAVRGGGSRLDHNMIPWKENWAVGSGSAPFFSQNGQSSENEREMGTDPFGNTSMLWKCGNDANSNADGGWNTDYFPVDNTVGYRYSVWVKRNSFDGVTYHGTVNVNNLLDDTPNGNPYFWAGDLPQPGQWYLLVGVVHPHDYAGGDTGVSGVYDTQGNKVLDGTEFKWDSQSSTSRFRNYMFYSTDTNARQYFYNPVLQKLDGAEASIDDILFEREAPDVVSPIVYDNFGRQTRDYMPYAADTQNGTIHLDPLAQVEAFYNVPKYEHTTNPYAEKILENSPLNRVLEQGAPGAAWLADAASDSDHTIKFGYDVNVADEVQLFEVSLGPEYSPALENPGFYAIADLYKTVVKDENWQPGDGKLHTTEEFTDKQGRVVLKRTYNAPPWGEPEGDEAYDTYYVYDKFGSLAYVLPPKVDTSDGVSQQELDELCYQYVYDYRRRLIEKKLPGKGWEYIVYNKLDQPVFTQDPNLAAGNQWMFTKYDKFGRVIYTGIFSSADSRETLQNTMNAATSMYDSKTIGTTNINGKDVYYTNQAAPDSNQELLTINYYDSYDFDLDGGTAEDAYGVTPTTQTKGLLTGSKTRVLGTNDWITTITWYDDKARPVYTYTRNAYLGTTDNVKYQLDFTGNVLETTTVHTKDGLADITTIEKFTYDRMGRLLSHTHQMAGQPEETLAENVYDALGQLAQKNVGNSSTAPLQTVDYSYNIRGWLTGINDINNPGNDLFSFAIRYNDPEAGGTALYNGNISQALWRTANTDNSLKNYSYSYDALNRITGAIDNTGNYNLNAVSYDKNGNILSLSRQGHVDEAADNFGVMDNLVYSYDSGNKLLKVEDTANDTYGFKDDAVATDDNNDDYTYDANGNMLSDTNKGITAISYNHLNLPEQVSINGENILYIYDASGIKLQKVATGTTTQYAGAYIYENSSLKFVNHAEGYIEPDGGGGYAYVYQYKDHLGNVRLSYSDANGNGAVDNTEIVEESNYYPFGLQQKGYNDVVSGTENNYQTYQGQELEEDFDKNVYAFQWRDYDPAIGRFNKIDRFSEKYYSHSPYHFAANNPLVFNEIKGDSLWINYKGNRILYENGNLYNRDGTAYTGKGVKVRKDGSVKVKGFLKKTVNALNDIRTGGSAGNELVTDLQNDAQHVFIGKGDNSARGLRVSWNPSDKNGGINQEGSTKRPSYIGLAHELGHAHDALDGTIDRSTWVTTSDGTQIPNAEIYASHWENRIRGENGLSLRTHYGIDNGTKIGNLLNTNGTSSHFTQQQVMPTLQWITQGNLFDGTYKVVPVSGTTTIVTPFKYK